MLVTTAKLTVQEHQLVSIVYTPFAFDERAIQAFTIGDCWHLAHTIRDITGWDSYALGYKAEVATDAPENADWDHMVTRHPSGYFIDITGISSEKAILKKWYEEFKDDTACSPIVFQANHPDFTASQKRNFSVNAQPYASSIIAMANGLLN